MALPRAGPGLLLRSWGLLVCLAACEAGAEYVIVSQPQLGALSYFRVDPLLHTVDPEAHRLPAHRLKEPLGLALDQRYQQLYVADARLKKVLVYDLVHSSNGLSIEGEREVTIKGLVPNWLTVGRDGAVYCTDERRNHIVKVSAKQFKHKEATGEVLYAAPREHAVDRPAGIIEDGRRVFWVNREHGLSQGSLVSALEVKPRRRRGTTGNTPPSVLSRNAEEVYGVCASKTKIYYTGKSRYVYAASKVEQHQAPVALLADLSSPRGCAWDGDGTVYVADKAGAIWSFAAAARSASRASASSIMHIEDPYGLVVFRPAAQPAGTLGSFLALGQERDPNSSAPRSSGPGLLAPLCVTVLSVILSLSYGSGR